MPPKEDIYLPEVCPYCFNADRSEAEPVNGQKGTLILEEKWHCNGCDQEWKVVYTATAKEITLHYVS